MSDPKWLEEDKRQAEPGRTVRCCHPGCTGLTSALNALDALDRAHAHIDELRQRIVRRNIHWQAFCMTPNHGPDCTGEVREDEALLSRQEPPEVENV